MLLSQLSELTLLLAGRLLSSCRNLMFFNTKRVPWDKVIRETVYDGGSESLMLSRGAAISLESRGETDHAGTQSMFGQGCRQMTGWNPKIMRKQGRCFTAVSSLHDHSLHTSSSDCVLFFCL